MPRTAPTAGVVDIVIPVGIRWLSPNEAESWRAFIETVGDLNTALERDLAGHGLTLGDYQVFVYLSESPDTAMRMCDLADRLHLSPSGLTRRLDGLVAAGFVTRLPSPTDGRVMMAVLTDEGRAKLAAAAPDHVDSVRRHIFDHLDAEQVTALYQIFSSISTGLTADLRSGAETDEVA